MYKYILVAFLYVAMDVTAQTVNPLFPTTIKDLGTVMQGMEQLTVAFDIKNTTGKTITIKSVHASCGCMEVIFPKHPIKQQGTGKVKITINVSKRHGYFSKSVLVKGTNVKPTVLKVNGIII